MVEVAAMTSRVSVKVKQTFLPPQNRSNIVGVVTVSNEYMSKILGQDVNIGDSATRLTPFWFFSL